MDFQLTDYYFFCNRTLRCYASGVRCSSKDAKLYAMRLSCVHGVDVYFMGTPDRGVAVGDSIMSLPA
jgi:hypothetical protein